MALKPSQASHDTQARQEAASSLCPACGMCCNGVLFGDVRMHTLREAKRLIALGLHVEKHRGGYKMRQPCACFSGTTCAVYPNRPAQCAAFECRLLQQVQAGRVPMEEAVEIVKGARKQVETVRKLVRQLGQQDETVPLNQRYATVMAEPLDLRGAGLAKLLRKRNRLTNAVSTLAQLLEKHYL